MKEETERLVDSVLEHHGVKGMKWGVRKDGSAGDSKTVAVKEAIRKATGAALGINNSPRYKGKDLTKDPALKNQYDSEVKKAFQHELKVASARAAVVVGVAVVSPAFPAAFGAVAAIAAHRIITTRSSSRVITGDFGVPNEAASSTFFMDPGLQHSATAGRTAYLLSADRDAKGFITKLFADEIAVAHTEDNVDGVELEHHGIKGMKWGVRRSTNPSTGLVVSSKGKAATPGESSGLIPRKGSADQIAQDRVVKKIKTNGIQSLSNTEIQSYTRRLQLEQDVKKALAAQSEAQKAKADGFIKSFVKSQGSRQADRFVNKALDVAFEAAVKQAGSKLEPTNPLLGKGLKDVAGRMAPKKGK